MPPKLIRIGYHFYERPIVVAAAREIVAKVPIVRVGVDDFTKVEKLLFDILRDIIDFETLEDED